MEQVGDFKIKKGYSESVIMSQNNDNSIIIDMMNDKQVIYKHTQPDDLDQIKEMNPIKEDENEIASSNSDNQNVISPQKLLKIEEEK